MPNKMLWHTEHIAYIPMVQKLSVCTCQTCQIKLMGVGHCFVWCYGYSIYISYITYPTIPTQTFVIKSPSLYSYPFRSRFTIKHQKTLFLFTSIFSYCRVKDQHPQTYRIERSNFYLNTFLKWQAHLKCFRHLRMVLSHYINISSLETDYYIPIT